MRGYTDKLGVSGLLMTVATQGNLSEIRQTASSANEYERSAAALAFGAYAAENRDKAALSDVRSVFRELVRLSFDRELYVRCDALLGLGRSKDSRAYFFLANYFERAPKLSPRSFELQKRVLYAFQENQDPRAAELIWRAKNDPILRRMAEQVNTDNTNFRYTFNGPEEQREQAEQKEGIIIASVQDLQKIEETLERNRKDAEKGSIQHPQTYVVDLEGRFKAGGDIEEHVQVASGQDVLAAGEAYFERDKQGWFIKSINNRSNGYYPHQNAHIHVAKALKGTGIRFPDKFTETFPKGGWLDDVLLEVKWKEALKLVGKKPDEIEQH